MTGVPMPRVSIGLPVYNGETHLRDALDSLLAQTFTDFELIVCDNASTDRTGDICLEYAVRDPRVRYFRNPENIGLAPNFSLAVDLARGEYFRWQAHDDICAPDLLQRCVDALDANPAAAMAYPGVTVIDQYGQPIVPRPEWADDPVRYDGRMVERFQRFVRPDRGSSIGIFIFGLCRMSALRRTRRMMSHQWADETCVTELLLEGPLVFVPERLLQLRVFQGHATSVMADQDLRGWQRILDPAYADGLRFWVARYRRYPEYFVSVMRASGRMSAGERVALLQHCAAVPFRRLLHSSRMGALRRQLVGVRKAVS